MAKKTAKITLGGEEYTVSSFTIGQLERITDIIQAANESKRANRITFDILRFALETAEPKVDDVEAIDGVTMEEITEAGRAIMELAGVKVTRDPPKPQETGEA